MIDDLQDDFPGTSHVFLLGIAEQTDRAIWDFASENQFTILTKDKDFYHLANTLGPPPKVVWITSGNFRNKDLLRMISSKVNEIKSFVAGGKAILIIS